MKNLIILTIILITHFSFASNISITNDIDNNIKKVTQIEDKITSEMDATKGFNRNIIVSNDDTINKINKSNWLNWFIPIIVALITFFQIKIYISKARISWCEKMREIISKYISEVENLNYELRILNDKFRELKNEMSVYRKENKEYSNDEFIKLIDKYKKNKDDNIKIIKIIKAFKSLEKRHYHLMIGTKKLSEFGNKISLYLNINQDKYHQELKELIDKYEEKSTENFRDVDDVVKLEKIKNEIIKKSQKIINDTWEDAKSFILTDIINICFNKKGGV